MAADVVELSSVTWWYTTDAAAGDPSPAFVAVFNRGSGPEVLCVKDNAADCDHAAAVAVAIS